MLRRLIHNALQTLKKDSGAHFTYNLGVSFVRSGVVLMCAAALFWLLFIINPADLLSYKGKTQASVTNLHIETIEHSGSRGGTHIVEKYHVTFNCTIGSTHAVAEQTVPHFVYSKYEKVGLNTVFPARLYHSRKTGLYVTERIAPLAQLEYGIEHSLLSMGIIALCCSGGGILMIAFGLNQERIGMKYPRTDVDLNGTSLTVPGEEVDDLLKEFDEAYEKFQANRAAGLPTSEPPRTDRDRQPQRRLEMKKPED